MAHVNTSDETGKRSNWSPQRAKSVLHNHAIFYIKSLKRLYNTSNINPPACMRKLTKMTWAKLKLCRQNHLPFINYINFKFKWFFSCFLVFFFLSFFSFSTSIRLLTIPPQKQLQFFYVSFFCQKFFMISFLIGNI